MENINRLQFVHCDQLFATREEAVDYAKTKVIIDRPALYAEPMVLKYGSEETPNILLAIGSVGDGVKPAMENKLFFIDAAELSEKLEQLAADNEELKESYYLDKEIIANTVQSAGFDEKGILIVDVEDELLSGTTSLTMSDKILSEALVAEIERAKAEEKRIEEKKLLVTVDTSSIKHVVEDSEDKVTLTSEVKLAKQYVVGDVAFNENLILDTENGLWSSIKVSEGEHTIDFNINGVVTEIPNIHVVNGSYSIEKEALVLELNDGSTIEVSLSKLIEEWGVLSEAEQQSPVYLTRTHVAYNEEVHGDGEYKDILEAHLRIANSEDNMLVVDNNNSLMVKKSNLEYNSSTNELVFNDGKDEKTITLNSGTVLERSYYQESTNQLILVFKLNNGTTSEVKINVADLMVKTQTNNDGKNVRLESHYDNETNTIYLSADVVISEQEDNILKTDGNSLYVKGDAYNIKYIDSTVGSTLDTVKADIVKTYKDLVIESNRAKYAEEDILNKINDIEAGTFKLEGGSTETSPIVVTVETSQDGVKIIKASLSVLPNEDNLLSVDGGSLFVSREASEHVGTYRDTEMTMQEALGRIAEEIDAKTSSNVNVDELVARIDALAATCELLQSENKELLQKVNELENKVYGELDNLIDFGTY